MIREIAEKQNSLKYVRGRTARIIFLAMIAGTSIVGRVSVAATVCDQQSLNAAISGASPGTTIVLCNQTWNDVRIGISKNGTAAAPITLKAETPGNVLLTGKSSVSIGGSYIVLDGLRFAGPYTGGEGAIVEFKFNGSLCRNCRLTNTSFVGYNPSDANVQTGWVRLFGQYNQVDHCYFVGKSNVGPVVNVIRDGTKPDYHRIDYNYFSRPALTSNGGESVKIGQNDDSNSAYSNSYTTVENNYFYRADGEIEMISVKSSGNTIRRNTIVESQGAITLRQGNGSVVSENFIFGHGRPRTSGIRIYADDHLVVNNFIADVNPEGAVRGGIIVGGGSDEQRSSGHRHARNVTVAFNTIVNSERSLVFGNGSSEVPPENITVANNIISSGKGPLIVYAIAASNAKYTDNIFYGSLGITKPQGIDIVDPQLTEDSEGTLRLLPNSPAIGRAKVSYDVNKDMDEQSRVTPLDIGADQHNGSGSKIKPLGACDVGPVTFDPSNSCGNAPSKPQPPNGLTVT